MKTGSSWRPSLGTGQSGLRSSSSCQGVRTMPSRIATTPQCGDKSDLSGSRMVRSSQHRSLAKQSQALLDRQLSSESIFLKSKKWTEQLQLPRDSVFVVRNARAISNKLSVAPRDSVFVVFLESENWTEQLQLSRDSFFVVRNARASSNKLSVARKTCTSVVFGAP